MKKLCLIFACVLTITACKRDDDSTGDATILVHHAQTNCADQWGNGDSDDATLTRLRNYLDQRNLYHTNEYITDSGPHLLCNSCQCTTGNLIYLRIMPAQQQQYAALGFKE